MAKTPQDAKATSMARDVDRLLSQLSRFGSRSESGTVQQAGAAKSAPRPAASAAPRPAASAAPRPAASAAPAKSTLELYSPPASSEKSEFITAETRVQIWLWSRVVLGIALGLFMNQWPYANACGWDLLGYGGAIVTVIITAAAIGFDSWRLRSGAAHIIALVLFYWGLVLAAEQVLPRLGYTGDRPSWKCPARLFVSN